MEAVMSFTPDTQSARNSYTSALCNVDNFFRPEFDKPQSLYDSIRHYVATEACFRKRDIPDFDPDDTRDIRLEVVDPKAQDAYMQVLHKYLATAEDLNIHREQLGHDLVKREEKRGQNQRVITIFGTPVGQEWEARALQMEVVADENGQERVTVIIFITRFVGEIL